MKKGKKIKAYSISHHVATGNCRNLIKNIYHSVMYYSKCRRRASTKNVKTIEFICSGNICRSIFAEKYASAILKKTGSSVISSSSGLFAKNDNSSPVEAIQVASLFNIDLKNHYPIKTSSQTIEKADLIMCMHFNQFLKLWKDFPSQRSKIYIMKAFTNKFSFNINIDDPYGKQRETFINCFKEIAENIDILLKQMN